VTLQGCAAALVVFLGLLVLAFAGGLVAGAFLRGVSLAAGW
jgi:hypothetical protein